LKRPLAIIVVCLLTTSCLHTMTASQVRPTPQSQERRQDFLLWGLVPLQSFTDNPCPRGIARVDTGMSGANFLFTAITFGIYWGMTVNVWCNDEPQGLPGVPATPQNFYVVPRS
jgi:hypothetical protein